MNIESENRSTDPLQRLARWIADDRTSMGGLARLRRMNPRHPEAALGILHDMLGDGILSSDLSRLQRWALIVHCLALARGRHRTSAPSFGRALVSVNFGELRMQQLLRADLDVLIDLLPRVARRLSAKSVVANWWPVAQLVLNVASTQQEPLSYPKYAIDPDKADEARLQIAKDFVIASSASAAAAN